VGLLATSVGLAAVGSFGGLVLASGILLVRDDTRVRVVSILISYAVGTLLAVALLRLLPEALGDLPPRQVLGSLLLGIFAFFVLEKLVIWRHCHETGECHVHDQTASLVMMGDAVHTFVDGAIIAAAVLTSVPLGITTAIAAAAHEIPQEIGDFAVLLQAGYSRKRAMLLNVVAGTTGILGAVVVYFAAGLVPGALPYAVSFAAGSFLYVAMSDLIPSLHRGQADPNPWRQVVLIVGGVATILAL
jgi:zinc and cadmium transporter